MPTRCSTSLDKASLFFPRGRVGSVDFQAAKEERWDVVAVKEEETVLLRSVCFGCCPSPLDLTRLFCTHRENQGTKERRYGFYWGLSQYSSKQRVPTLVEPLQRLEERKWRMMCSRCTVPWKGACTRKQLWKYHSNLFNFFFWCEACLQVSLVSFLLKEFNPYYVNSMLLVLTNQLLAGKLKPITPS